MRVGQHLTEDVPEFQGREKRINQWVECLRILDQPQSRREGNLPRPLESVERGIQQGRQDFACPVGAKIRHQQAVTVLHAGEVADDRGLQKLVRDAGIVGMSDRLEGILGALPFGLRDQAIGALHTIPTFVAIHRKIAAANRRQWRAAGFLHEGFKIAQCRGRRCVAAVEEGVNSNRNFRIGENSGEGRNLILMGMDAPRRHEASDMGCAAAFAHGRDKSQKIRMTLQRAVGDRCVDAR